ncbi:polysaccharide biosynthesis tyrosine autokinase [Saccharopolyspora shandongensis]|uniref:polysaccharide biosynthesis tyrosine autokinase n=1 Tax=Saccharopolyspora shandongensis TaxID=418495 RepID=UPI0033C4C82D
MNFRQYFRVLREGWALVVTALIVGLSAAAGVTLLSDKQYTADVTLFVSAQSTGSGLDDAYHGILLSQQKVQSYVELMNSERVRQDAVRASGLKLTPDYLEGKITTEAKTDTVVLTVKVQDESPERARILTDAVVNSFIRLVGDLERTEVSPTNPRGTPSVVARVVAPAERPADPVSPRPLLNLVLGASLGLAVGYGAALLRHILDTTIKSVDSLQEVTGNPVLGSVAFDEGVPNRPLILHEDPKSSRSEAFRRIRTNLQFADLDQPCKTVLMTSSVPGEGKSTTLCNLAITLAQSGKRVAVVEADLRQPRMDDYFGIEGGIGLTNVLLGELELDTVLQPWGGHLFDVIGSGPLPPNPSELLGGQHMAAVLSELARRYDIVLIDSPPLLPVTDAAALASQTDGVLLAVKYGKTSRRQVTDAMAALTAVPARVLGTVLTMVPEVGKRSDYYPYYEDSPRLEDVVRNIPPAGVKQVAPVPSMPADQADGGPNR